MERLRLTRPHRELQRRLSSGDQGVQSSTVTAISRLTHAYQARLRTLIVSHKGKSVCNCQRRALIRFKRNLLREHYVAWNEIPFWHKAPPDVRLTVAIEFVNVGRRTVENAITLSGIVADDLKPSEFFELRLLLRRQPFSEKGHAARLTDVIIDKYSAPLAPGLNLARAISQKTQQGTR